MQIVHRIRVFILLVIAAVSLRSTLGTSDTSDEDGFHGRIGIGRIEYLKYDCYPVLKRYVVRLWLMKN